MKLFIFALRKTQCIRKSARYCKRAPVTLYAWRAKYPGFKRKWDKAVLDRLPLLEDTAYSLAVNGVREPIIQGGVKCGWRVKFFPKLILELLRAKNPDEFGRALLPAEERDFDADARAAAIRERLRMMDDSVPEQRAP